MDREQRNNPVTNDMLVLVHGYTLSAIEGAGAKNRVRSWQHVVVGDFSENQPGRLPVAIAFALQIRAKRLLFGSGASALFEERAISRNQWKEMGMPRNVKWEAEYTFDILLKQLPSLCVFSDLANEIRRFGGIDRALEFIKGIASLDVDSKGTPEEIAGAVNSSGVIEML